MDTSLSSLSSSETARTFAQVLTDGKREYLDYDFQARLVRRRGKPFDTAVAARNLLTLKSVFDRHGVTFWLVYGTCLGAVRDGRFIPHDTDTDIGVFQHDRPKLIAAMPDLMREGMMPIRTKRPDDLLTFMRDDEYIDIGIFGKHRDAEGFDYWCYQENRVYGDHFDRFEKVDFLGQTFLIPQRAEVFLAALYGPGWKAPVANQPGKVLRERREFETFSNLVALADFFRDMPDHAVLKLPAYFPSYYDYSDIDILCADRPAVRAHIARVAQSYIARGFIFRESDHQGHLHLDLYAPGAKRLNIRFDLLDSLGEYRKLSIAPEFASAILAQRTKHVQHDVQVSVPNVAHDLALRFLEYVEWKDERPDKIKHLEYVKKSGRLDFVEIVNRFTDLVVTVSGTNGSKNLSWKRRRETPETTDRSAIDRLVQQAGIHQKEERHAEAAEQYCTALHLAPEDASILVPLGRCLEVLNDRLSAGWCYERAVTLHPANSEASAALQQLAASGNAPCAVSAA